MIQKCILFFIFSAVADSLFESVEDKNKLNAEGLINVITFGRESVEILKDIIPKKDSFRNKKREYFKALDRYGMEHKKTVVSLFNKIINVYDTLPDYYQKLSRKIHDDFESGKYNFDLESFNHIVKRIEAVYDKKSKFDLFETKMAFDATIKYFQQSFYSPIRMIDYNNEKSKTGRLVIDLLFYIFGKPREDKFPSDDSTRDEL